MGAAAMLTTCTVVVTYETTPTTTNHACLAPRCNSKRAAEHVKRNFLQCQNTKLLDFQDDAPHVFGARVHGSRLRPIQNVQGMSTEAVVTHTWQRFLDR